MCTSDLGHVDPPVCTSDPGGTSIPLRTSTPGVHVGTWVCTSTSGWCTSTPLVHVDTRVVHVDTRGTKKAVDDAIYEAGANNLRSAHMDFPGLGMAYDLSALDRNLDEDQARELAQAAARMTGDPNAVRSVRAIPLDTDNAAS